MHVKHLGSVALILCGAAAPAATMTIGDGRIDGKRVAPYRFTFSQCAKQGDQWQDAGALTEELVVIGDHVLRHRQIGHSPGGVVHRSDAYFDRASFAPLRLEQTVTRDGEIVVSAEQRLDASGYTGTETRGDTTGPLEGRISSAMLHGSVMGLPLATMEVSDEPVEFLASMVAFDAVYDVTARWVGEEIIEFGDHEVVARLIDVEWHHHETGDVYAPGPEASGGRFWVVADPPAGLPYVARYQTDTYAVEFVASVCSVSGE